jgi:hypothetical protein
MARLRTDMEVARLRAEAEWQRRHLQEEVARVRTHTRAHVRTRTHARTHVTNASPAAAALIAEGNK